MAASSLRTIISNCVNKSKVVGTLIVSILELYNIIILIHTYLTRDESNIVPNFTISV